MVEGFVRDGTVKSWSEPVQFWLDAMIPSRPLRCGCLRSPGVELVCLSLAAFPHFPTSFHLSRIAAAGRGNNKRRRVD